MDKFTKDQIELSKLTKRLILVPFGQSFRFCNNNCSFCYLKDYMVEKPLSVEQCNKIASNVYKWITDIVTEIPQDVTVSLEIIGGEMFMMSNEYYDIYYKLATDINKVLSKYNIQFDILLISNLLLDSNRLERLKNLYVDLTKHCKSVEISTSFDLWGRFKNVKDIELWYDNLLSLSEVTKISIEVILSNPALDIYLNDHNCIELEVFKRLLEEGNRFNICFNEFVPNSEETIELVPSNDKLIVFYKDLIDKYWNRLSELDNFKYSNKAINVDYAKSSAYCAECAGPVFGLPGETDHGFDFDYEEYGIYKTYCAETGILSPWKKSDGKIRKDLYKVDIPTNEWICLKYPEIVNNYFDSILKCSSCQFRNSCFNNRQQECYVMHQFKWKEDKCWKKEIFKYVLDKGLCNE